jgi:lipopolysaccharide export system permease protein
MRQIHFRILFWYIAREYLFSFFVSFLFFFFLFFVNQLLVIARDVLSRQVDFGSTVLLIIYAIPALVALAVPFASLVGTLMAVGRFSADNEITVMQACGVSLLAIFMPILIMAFLAAMVSFVMNDFFLPLGTIEYIKLYQNLLFTNSELVLQPYSVTRYKNASIVTDTVKNGQVGHILIMDTDEQGQQRVMSASSGQLSRNDAQAGIISMDLRDVFIFDLVSGYSSFNYSKVQDVTYNMLLRNFTSNLHNPSPREMSSADVYDRIQEMEAKQRLTMAKKWQDVAMREWAFLDAYRDKAGGAGAAVSGQDKATQLLPMAAEIANLEKAPTFNSELQWYWIEFWKKYSIPAACFTLIFLGFPAGMFAKRSGRSIGFGIGFVIAVIFWSLLLLGQSVAMDNAALSPMLAMWFPNLLFFVAGVVLLARRILR